MRFAIRPAVETDVPGIVTVEIMSGRLSEAGAESFAAKLGAAITDDGRLVLVAEAQPDMTSGSGSAVVGWAKTHQYGVGDGPAPAGQYLGGVTVVPDLRRHGLAAALTSARLEWIWRRADTAWCVVNARNEASLALHRQWGFHEVARGSAFHGVTFDGGKGVLLAAARSPS
ncbi:GNAT family N-acetyltransferase [Paenarthrobacter sp. NPDC057981]|uniref:GNAT family N-acetyltransferase n=1 Tax=Paenarthrobacter sp. NPDC057981 TaxID=3346297 RepID=UPI0036DA6EC8